MPRDNYQRPTPFANGDIQALYDALISRFDSTLKDPRDVEKPLCGKIMGGEIDQIIVHDNNIIPDLDPPYDREMHFGYSPLCTYGMLVFRGDENWVQGLDSYTLFGYRDGSWFPVTDVFGNLIIHDNSDFEINSTATPLWFLTAPYTKFKLQLDLVSSIPNPDAYGTFSLILLHELPRGIKNPFDATVVGTSDPVIDTPVANLNSGGNIFIYPTNTPSQILSSAGAITGINASNVGTRDMIVDVVINNLYPTGFEPAWSFIVPKGGVIDYTFSSRPMRYNLVTVRGRVNVVGGSPGSDELIVNVTYIT